VPRPAVAAPLMCRPVRLVPFRPEELTVVPPEPGSEAPALRMPDGKALLVLSSEDDQDVSVAWTTWLPNAGLAAGAAASQDCPYQLYAIVSPTQDSIQDDTPPTPERPLRLAVLGWEIWRSKPRRRPPPMPAWMQSLVTHLLLGNLSLRASVVAGMAAGKVYRDGLPPRMPLSPQDRPASVPLPGPAPRSKGLVRLHLAAAAPPALVRAERITLGVTSGGAAARYVPTCLWTPPPTAVTCTARIPVTPILAADDDLAARYAKALLGRLGPRVVAVITPADLDRIFHADALAPLLGAERAALPQLVADVLGRSHGRRNTAACAVLHSLLAAKDPQALAALLPDVTRLVLLLPMYHLHGDPLLRAAILAWLDARRPGHRKRGAAPEGASPTLAGPATRSAAHVIVYRPVAGAETFVRTLALALATWVAPTQDPIRPMPPSLAVVAALGVARDVTPEGIAEIAPVHAAHHSDPLLARLTISALEPAPGEASSFAALGAPPSAAAAVETMWRDASLFLSPGESQKFMDRMLPRLALFPTPRHVTHWLGLKALSAAERADAAQLSYFAAEAQLANNSNADVIVLSYLRRLRAKSAKATRSAAAAKRALRMWILPAEDDAHERDCPVSSLLVPHNRQWRKELADLVGLPMPRHCYSCLDDDAHVAGCSLNCGHRLCARCLFHNPRAQCSFCRQDIRRFALCGQQAPPSAGPDPGRRPRTRSLTQPPPDSLLEAIQGAGTPAAPPLVAPTVATADDLRIATNHGLRPRLVQWVRQQLRAAAGRGEPAGRSPPASPTCSGAGRSAAPASRTESGGAPGQRQHHRFVAIITQHRGDSVFQTVTLPRKLSRTHTASLSIIYAQLPQASPIPQQDPPVMAALRRGVLALDAEVGRDFASAPAEAVRHVVLVAASAPHTILLAQQLAARGDVHHFHLIVQPGSLQEEVLTDWTHARGAATLPHPGWSETSASADAESAYHFSVTDIADDADEPDGDDLLRMRAEGGEDDDDEDDADANDDDDDEDANESDAEPVSVLGDFSDQASDDDEGDEDDGESEGDDEEEGESEEEGDEEDDGGGSSEA